MIIFLKSKTFLRIIFIVFLLLLPWSNANYFDNINAAKPTQEDSSFYEINTCQISLLEFLIENKSSMADDTLILLADDYSSIRCFGRVTAIFIENNIIYVSFGTNVLLNFLIQSIFWLSIFSFIKKDKNEFKIDKKLYYLSIFSLSYFLVYIVYAEQIFYESTIYQLKLNDFTSLSDKTSLLVLFILFLFILKAFIDTTLPRFYNLINYLPFIYLIISINSGFNLVFYLIIFMFFGVIAILLKNYNKKLNRYYLLFSVFWIFNASGSFYLPLGSKNTFRSLRGFSSSIYNFNSVLAWTVIIFLLINGLLFVYRKNKSYVDINRLLNSFDIVAILILALGYIGSTFPVMSFLNYYYLGQANISEKISNSFSLNNLIEKISSNGFYASQASVGEFYGIIIILTIICFIEKRKISILNYIGLVFSLVGLYLSRNLLVISFILFVIIFLILKEINFNNNFKNLIMTSLFFLIAFIFGYRNLEHSYDYISEALLNKALTYQLDTQSSFLMLLTKSFEDNSPLYILFIIISYVSYFLNSIDLWAIFLAKYNPSFLELLVGSGPFNYGQYFQEIKITKEVDQLLIPHTSFFSLIIFIGFFGFGLLCYFILLKVIKNKVNLNSYGYIFLIYIFKSLFFNDSINYFSSFTLYSFLIYIILNLNNKELFDFTKSRLT